MAQFRTSKKKCKSLTLFGGDNDWNAEDWTSSDDSVRGGKSTSYLDFDKGKARFHGTLDIETLGGAGFASQRTTGDDREWDLSDYAGIELDIAKGDKKRYTFIVKDELLPPNSANGREQSTISWELDFELPPQDEPDETQDKTVFIPWEAFTPTYRGKVQKDVDPLNTKKTKRFNIMMRSFFGSQEDGNEVATANLTKKDVDPRQLENGPNTAERERNYYVFDLGPRSLLNGNVKIHRQTAHALIAAALILAVYHYFRN